MRVLMPWICLGLLPVLMPAGVVCAREGPSPISDELRRSPIQIGVQYMAGYRSNYVYRGIKMGEQVMEGQVASSISISNDWALAGEVDFVRGFFSKDFAHTTLYGELQYYIGQEAVIGPSFAGQFHTHADFKSGCEPGIVWRWSPINDFEMGASGVYDSGQKGFYGNVSATWQPLITQKIAWVNTAILGSSADYMDASGPSDATLRTSWLIRLGASFRLEPFISVTFGMGDRKKNFLAGGVWFTWMY